MKLITEREMELRRERARGRRLLPKRPRCACGCNRAANWPLSGEPIFHTRLCGYRMAVGIILKRRNRGKVSR